MNENVHAHLILTALAQLHQTIHEEIQRVELAHDFRYYRVHRVVKAAGVLCTTSQHRTQDATLKKVLQKGLRLIDVDDF